MTVKSLAKKVIDKVTTQSGSNRAASTSATKPNSVFEDNIRRTSNKAADSNSGKYSERVLNEAKSLGITEELLDKIKAYLGKNGKKQVSEELLLAELKNISNAVGDGLWSSAEEYINAQIKDASGLRKRRLKSGVLSTNAYIEKTYNKYRTEEGRLDYYNRNFATKEARQAYVEYLKNDLKVADITEALGGISEEDFIENGIDKDAFVSGKINPPGFVQDVKRFIQTDIIKLFNNSSDKEKIKIIKAILRISVNHEIVAEMFELLFNIVDDQSLKTKMANAILEADENYAATHQDMLGEYLTEEQLQKIAKIGAENRDCKHNKRHGKDAHKTAKENQEAAARAREKIENGEALTEEDEAALRQEEASRAIIAGHIVGVSNSNVMTQEEIEEHLINVNNDYQELEIYREVIEKVNEYVETHPETLKMTKEEFQQTMDKVTNGNYSIVVEDAKNGTTTELNPPTPVSSKNTGSDSTQPSQTTNNVVNNANETANQNSSKTVTETYSAANQNSTQQPAGATVSTPSSDNAAKNNIQEQSQPQITSYTSVAQAVSVEGVKGFSSYAKINGAVAAIKEVFSNLSDIHNQGVIRKATRAYEDRVDRQDEILHSVGTAAIGMLLAHTSDITMKKLDGETFNSFYATKLVKDSVEDMKERVEYTC